MKRWQPCTHRLLWLVLGVGWLLILLPGPAPAAIDPEELATRIADSLKDKLAAGKYQTVAISRIRQEGTRYDVTDLIDFANVRIVQSRRLRVIDRSKLELILKEQQVQLSDFVSAQKYQELGRLMGVDLFVYGTFYKDALVLKGIDVQNSAIVWADSFPTGGIEGESALLRSLGDSVMASLKKDLGRLQKAKIHLISFWDLETEGGFSPQSVMDYISVAITQDGDFRVVDRENLRLITEEQQLNQNVFIDQKNAKRLGELYGVDAFIYGGVKRRKEGGYLASLKLLNIFNGVIEWADLIRMEDAPAPRGDGSAGGTGAQGMVSIPAGLFLMGTNDGPRHAAPLHQVNLPAYRIDEGEVSNAEYQKFVLARNYRAPVGWVGTSYPEGAGDLPVVGVNWVDARRYCEFAGKRLPSEQEWEKAARGPGGQKYPWQGNTFSPSFTVTRESGRKLPLAVNEPTRDVSPYGVKHLAGNVREWVEDTFAAYQANARISDPRFGRERVVRGASWATDYHSAPAYFRGASNPSLAWQDLGFRCASSP